MEWNISKGIEVSKLGKKYYFDGQCEWSKKSEDTARHCHHEDCIKSFWINHTIDLIRRELLDLTK